MPWPSEIQMSTQVNQNSITYFDKLTTKIKRYRKNF